MRQETKLIKDILKSNYPDKKFKLKYRQAKNYIDSSDKLIVACPPDVKVDEIISLIQKYVQGIKVFEEQSVGSIFEHFGEINTPKIFSFDLYEWIETDLMEFIEVKIDR